MHVHLPKPLHGWRAFAGEVGIIVVGVLIALGAEQAVEALHWRDKVRSAESAMRIELAEDDGPQAYGRIAIGICLDRQIGRIHDGAGKAPPDQLRQWITDYAPPFRTWDSEAWKTVLASDVGSHMGSDRLIVWSSPYRVMPTTTDFNARETELATELREALPPTGTPSGEDLQNVRRIAAQLKMLNRRLTRTSYLLLARSSKVGASVPVPVQRTLLSEARTIYGGCVRRPDLNAPVEAESFTANLRAGTVL
jgi:hypothetical protein